MSEDSELDSLQVAYKDAVDTWIAAIQEERSLVAVTPHSIADVDKWEHAHFTEEGARNLAKKAKEIYEEALRSRFFGF